MLSAGSELAVWREGFRGLVADRARAQGRPARVHVKYDSGMGRLGNPDPDRGAGAGAGLRRGPRPPAGRHLDPFRDRRRTRLGLLRRAARRASRRWPRRSRPSSPESSPTPPTAPRSSATRAPTSTWPAAASPSTASIRSRATRPSRACARRSRCAPTSPTSSASRRRQRRLRPEAGGPPVDTWVGVIPLGYGDGVRRGLGNNAEVLVARAAPSPGRDRLDGQPHDRPRARDRGRARRRGGPDRRPGRRGDPRRGGRRSPRDDQLRGHLRDLGRGCRGARHERPGDRLARRAPGRCRGAAGAGRTAETSGSSAARCATRRWGGRSPISTSPSAAIPARSAQARSRRELGEHAFELSAEFGTWRVVAPRRGWQIDVTALRGGRIEADLGRARLHDRRGRRAPRPATSRSIPSGASPTSSASVLRAVGEESFAADPLRLLRAARLAAELELEIEPGTVALARAAAAYAADPAGERQLAELRQLLGGPDPLRGLALLDELELTAVVLPELEELRGVEQGPEPPPRRPRPHAGRARAHAGGRGGPRALRRRACRRGRGAAGGAARRRDEPRRTALRFGALFHDIGKPATRAEYDGFVGFHGPRRGGRGDRRRDLPPPARQPPPDPAPAGR